MSKTLIILLITRWHNLILLFSSLVKHMTNYISDEQILYRLHIVRVGRNLSVNEAPLIAYLFHLKVAFVLADHSPLSDRQVELRGDQCDRKRLGSLIKIELVEPFIEILETILLDKTVA